MEIDLYEFKGTLKKFEGDNFIEFCEDKSVSIIEVGKTNKEINKRLEAEGYQKGDKVLVIIQ
ncbi:MAG: hypothetical protein ABIH28_00430 [archaeon]